jgi:hypothetical protein
MAGRGPNAHRELDGRYAARAGRQKPPSTRHLIALWVQEWTTKLRRLGSSFDEIARELSKAGRGKGSLVGSGLNLRPMVELPNGVVFPPDYRISARAVLKAFRKALARRTDLAVDELRAVAHDRLETLYLATQGGVGRGNPAAIRAAVVVLREHALIFGYAQADPQELAAARSRQEEEERREALAVVRAMTPEERDQYADILERVQARLKPGSAANADDSSEQD